MSKESKRRILGASIVPYSIDTQWGNMYILLGKERKVMRWTGSEKWSDFGGGCKSQDSAPEYTAAREFDEETCASVRYWEGEELPRKSYIAIAKSLLNGDYTFKITTLINDDLVYYCYVKQIPFDAAAPKTHVNTFTSLLKMRMDLSKGIDVTVPPELIEHPAVQGVESNMLNVNGDFLEKPTVRWWSLPQLRKAVRERRGIITFKNMRAEQLRTSFRSRLEVVLNEFPDERTNCVRKAETITPHTYQKPVQIHTDDDKPNRSDGQ